MRKSLTLFSVLILVVSCQSDNSADIVKRFVKDCLTSQFETAYQLISKEDQNILTLEEFTEKYGKETYMEDLVSDIKVVSKKKERNQNAIKIAYKVPDKAEVMKELMPDILADAFSGDEKDYEQMFKEKVKSGDLPLQHDTVVIKTINENGQWVVYLGEKKKSLLAKIISNEINNNLGKAYVQCEKALELYPEDSLFQKKLVQIEADIKENAAKKREEKKLYATQGKWKLKYFVDEFNEKTKAGYIELRDVDGTFSNSATDNSKLTAILLVTDKNEVQIFLKEYGSSLVKSYSYESYTIFTLHNGVKKGFNGYMTSDRVVVEDSQKFLDVIKQGGRIKIYIKEAGRYASSTYLFEMDFTNLDKAMKKLKGEH